MKSKNPFKNLPILTNSEPLTLEFVEAYVKPFYLSLNQPNRLRDAYFGLKEPCGPSAVTRLLGERNWRMLTVGAYFAAVGNMSFLEMDIGNLLLRAEFIHCASSYCIALAAFSSDSAIEYLHEYLDHYLDHPGHTTDQRRVMVALGYLGEQRGQDLIERHLPAWYRFEVGRDHTNLEKAIEGFSVTMGELNDLKLEISRQ